MRKFVMFWFLLPGLSFGSNPIQAKDIPTVIAAAKQINADNQALNQFAQTVSSLISSNYTFTIPGSGEVVTMTAQQQQDMFLAYTQLKANVLADTLNLP